MGCGRWCPRRRWARWRTTGRRSQCSPATWAPTGRCPCRHYSTHVRGRTPQPPRLRVWILPSPVASLIGAVHPTRFLCQNRTSTKIRLLFCRYFPSLESAALSLLTPLTCPADAGAFIYRQAFQQHQQQYQQHSACSTPTAAALTPRACVGSGLPCLTPVRLPDSCPVAPPSVSGSDRSPRASGPVLGEIAGVLTRAAGTAQPLPAEASDTTPTELLSARIISHFKNA